jgi:SNF2 family DNA or RNA helicase
MKLMAHQKEAVRKGWLKEGFAYFHEQGLGKTILTLFEAKKLWGEGLLDAVVVVAPNGVHVNWVKNEVPKVFSNTEVTNHVYYAERPFKAPKQDNTKLQIFCFNVDGFTSPKARALITEILDTRRVMLVVDESQRIKNGSALRTRFLIVQGRKAAFRRILSGTPITKGIEDLYSQFQFLGVGLTRFKSFYGFRSTFCKMDGFEGRKIIGYQNQDWLQDLLAPHMDRRLKEECLDLPPKIYINELIPMTPEQKALYHAVRKESIEELTRLMGAEDGLAAAAEAAVVRLIRLRQISGGFDPYTQKPMAGGNPKLDRLKDLVEELGEEKVVIFCSFVPEIEAVAKALGDSAVTYYGATDARTRADVVTQFMEDPAKKYFVSNAQTGGLGITLTAARRVFFFSNSFDLEHRLQGEDRIHRIGQAQSCFYYDFECGPVDRKIIGALRSKNTVKAEFLKDPLGAFLSYTEDI